MPRPGSSTHCCVSWTPAATRLSILNCVLDSPRSLLHRYSDAQLLEVEAEANQILERLRGEFRCTTCGARLPERAARQDMANELAYVWAGL